MARFVGDKGEGKQPQLSIVERTAAVASAAIMARATVVPPVTAIRQVIGVSKTTV